MVGESSRVFVLEAENLVDFLFGRDSPSVDWPKNMLSVGILACIYLVII